MHRRIGKIKYLYLSILGLSALGLYIHTISPQTWLIVLGLISILVATVLFAMQFFFQSWQRSVLYSTSIGVLLFLRYLHLRDSIYPLLVILFIILLEVYWQKK